MDVTPPHDRASRRWPLRTGLLAVLVLLLVVGARENNVGFAASPTTSVAPSTTTSLPTTSTTTSQSPTTTTTAPASRYPFAQPPVSTYLDLNKPAKGCGLALTPPATHGAPKFSETPRSVPTRAVGHCTVLEIGDSIGSDLGWGLQRELSANKSLRLVELDRSSTGLAASWYYDWPAHLHTYLAQYRPDLVIVCLGGNDEQALAVKGVSQPFGSPGWRDAYTARVRQIDSMITAAHSYVLWVGLPIMEPPQFSQGANALNAVYRHVATSVPGVTFLPSWQVFANKDGQYRNAALVNGRPQVLRSTDGIHFSYVGENVFATYVTDELSTIFHVRVSPQAPAYARR